MSTAREFLEAVQQRADAATDGPWHALSSGRAGGDHWHVCDDGESIAYIHASDGEDEDQRQPDAEFIASSRTDVPRLVAALTAVLDLHRPETDDDAPDGWPYCTACGVDVYEEPIPWPCETVRAITAALTPKENDS